MSEQEQQAPVVVEKKKWYEEQGGFGFEVGDIVLLDKSNPIIANRFAEVVSASDKKDHIKARLQNQKSGELQGTTVVLDNKTLTLVAKGGIGNAVVDAVKDICIMEPSGIYKTNEQVAAELDKKKSGKKNEETSNEDLAQAQ